MGKSFIYRIFIACIILLMLYSIHAWFLWGVYGFALDVFTAFIAILYLSSEKIPNKLSGKDITIFLLYCLASVWQQWGGLEILSSFHPSFLFLLMLKPEHYKDLLKAWTNTYAVILAISLIAWFMITANPGGSLLPNLEIISYQDIEDYTYYNYFLCLWRVIPSFRFNSIFLEPGHVAMYAVFTIAVNRFNFKKWQNIVFLICIIFTFSLAGYVLVILGAVIYLLLNKRNVRYFLVSAVLTSVVVVSGYYIAINFNSGDNLVNLLIIERLEFDDEYGIEGNNRTNESTSQKFDKLLHSPELVTGLPESEYKMYMKSEVIHGAGYKVFMLQKGIVGLVLFLLLYHLLLKKYRDRRFGVTLFILYIVAFIQRATPFLETWIFLFLFASSLDTLYLPKKNRNFNTIR